MLAAGDCAHAQPVVCAICGNAIASLASLIVVGLMDADSGPLGPERSLHFDALAKNR